MKTRVVRVAPREERRVEGILLMVAALTCFTGIDSSAKWLVQSLPPLEVAFVRYLGHFVLVLAIYLPLYGASLWRTRALGREIWRGVFLLGSTVLNFIAVQFLPLATTSSIAFTSPLWLCALSGPLLGEKVGIRRWSAVIAGFLGVLVVIQPGTASFHWAVFLSLGMAVSVSLYAIMTRRLAGTDATETQQFYAALVAVVALAPVAFLEWRWPEGGVDWTLFLAIGFFGWLGHQLLTMAFRLAPATVLAPITYVQLVPMTLAGYLFFGDRPDVWVFVGAAIVVGSGLYVWARERQLARRGR